MTRGQYIAMCMIGAVAIIAYLQGRQIAAAFNAMMQSGGAAGSSGKISI